MYPPPFEYVAPDTIEEAIQALSEGGEDAKILSGGMSVIPLMKLRFARSLTLTASRAWITFKRMAPASVWGRLLATVHWSGPIC